MLFWREFSHVIVEASCLTATRRFFEPLSIPMENYGVGNVEEYADRCSSHGRNKSCDR